MPPPQQRRQQRPSPTPSTSTDVATTTTGRGTLTSFIETYEGDFSRVMPGHVNVQAFVGLAAAYVRRDDKLRVAAQANPASLILALRECAALGHTPIPKIFALVPFRVGAKDGKPATWSITGIETYHGVIERMYRAGGVQSVHCELVRRNDRFRWDAMNQRVTVHEYDPFMSDEERGELMGVYAWARLFTGGMSQVVWMNRAEVMKHRAASRSGDAFWGGPWEPSMWRKTGLHGLEIYVPTSAEYRWTVALSGSATASGFAGIPDVPVLEYGPSPDDGPIDAELVDNVAPPAARAVRQAPQEPEPVRAATTTVPTPRNRSQRAAPPAEPAAPDQSDRATGADQDDMGGADPDHDPQLPDPDAPPAPTGPDGWPETPTIPDGGKTT